MKEVLLRINNINKSFSGVKVLDNVSIELKKGSTLGLVGENGAGKSTLMNIIGGVLPSDSGRMDLEGKDFTPLNPIDASKSGIVFIHQELNLFTNLSVAENIFIENFPKNKIKGLSYKKMNKEAKKILEVLDETVNPGTLAENIPMGTRQMVEISKALTKDAKIIIFDEPTTSLSTKEKEKLFLIIQKLVRENVSIIYISHMLDDVFQLCDEIAILRDGKLITQQPKERLDRKNVIRMMVGRELNMLFPYLEKVPGEEVLKVENLSQGNMLHGISLNLHESEIVGIFGLMGAGRSELVRAIYGLDEFNEGSVFYRGNKVQKFKPAEWIKKGVVLITENRREEGLLLTKPVKDNLVLADLNQIKGPLNSINTKTEDLKSEWAIGKLKIKTYDKKRQLGIMLSGGNQQKTVVGKWLLTKPKVFLIDEPTRGIDVGAKYEMYKLINELAKEKSAILLISSEMDELIGVCDRILVMCKGKITAELERENFLQEDLMKFAIGEA